MRNAWRQAINAVLGTFLIAGMTVLPPDPGGAAYAQSEGDTRTVQQEVGTRTDTAAETSAAYDPGTGVTTFRRKQDSIRLYRERTETYHQVGNRTETRYRQEPAYETRYRQEQRQRQEEQQIARTGYREETRRETRYRPVYETKTREVARTAYRTEDRTGTRQVERWYHQPGYYEPYNVEELIYPGGTWSTVRRSRWVDGYDYSVLENEPYTYQVEVPYSYLATETYQEQAKDVTGTRDVYGYTWVTEPYRSYELLYPGNTYGYVDRTRQVWKYAYLGQDPILTPRMEAYEVPVTVKVAYTYYEPVTVNVTYYADVPYEVKTGTRMIAYQVVVPDYDWVPDGNWQPKEEITRSSHITVGRSAPAVAVAEGTGPARAQSSTFLSDSGTSNTLTQIAGSKKRTVFKADEVAASNAKKVDISTNGNDGNVKGNHNDQDHATPGPIGGFSLNDWVGTWTQGNYTVVIKREGNGIDYEFRLRNGNSWENYLGGSLSNGNATFTDTIGGDIGTGADLTLSRVGGALRLNGTIQCNGARYTLENLRK